MTNDYQAELTEAFGFDRADAIREAYGDPCPTHGILRYGGDCPRCEAEFEGIIVLTPAPAPAPASAPEALCSLCHHPVLFDDNTVDHFIYKCGELDYIELYHRTCAEAEGYVIDAEGHVTGRVNRDACFDDPQWLADFEAREAFNASIRARG